MVGLSESQRRVAAAKTDVTLLLEEPHRGPVFTVPGLQGSAWNPDLETESPSLTTLACVFDAVRQQPPGSGVQRQGAQAL